MASGPPARDAIGEIEVKLIWRGIGKAEKFGKIYFGLLGNQPTEPKKGPRPLKLYCENENRYYYHLRMRIVIIYFLSQLRYQGAGEFAGMLLISGC